MQTHFTTDPTTGYLDIPNDIAICDGECGEAYMERNLHDFCGSSYCEDCHPKCLTTDCGNLQHEQGDELCAACNLRVAREESNAHWISAPNPMQDSWFRDGLALDVHVKIWEARQ